MALMQQFLAGKSGKQRWDRCLCDICNLEFEQKTTVTKERRNGKLALGRDLCVSCSKAENIKNVVKAGTKSLTSRTKEERIEHARHGGVSSAKSGTFNPSKFSTEKWNRLTLEEQKMRVTKANRGLQEKLKDPVFAAQHYAKVMAQMTIGYMSKGHVALHECLKELGFVSHYQIGTMQVDECNPDLKVVVEYNGDMWHCNPKSWKADDYNTAIRMTAGEKWANDIARHTMLKKFGYKVVVIWESDWIADASKQIDKVKEVIFETCTLALN